MPHQSAAAAAVAQPNGNGNVHDPPSASPSSSSLTPAEQREKEYRRQQYEAAEQERLRKHREYLKEQAAAQQAAHKEAEQRRTERLKARGPTARQREEAEAVEQGRVGKVTASDGASLLPNANRNEQGFRRFGESREKENRNRVFRPEGQGEHNVANQKAFRPQDNQRPLQYRGRSSSAGRIEMPDFGSASNQQSDQRAADSGWGSGAAETQPLKYASEEQRLAREAELKAQETSHRTSSRSETPDVSGAMSDIFPGLNFNSGARDPKSRSASRAFRGRGPSPTQDPFWSSQHASDPPPPPPPQPSTAFSTGDFGDTGYRTSPFDPAAEYSSSSYTRESTSTESRDSWSHLRKKGVKDASSLQQSLLPSQPHPLQANGQAPQPRIRLQRSQSTAPQRPSYRQSQDEIDSNFRDYQAQRTQRAPRFVTSNHSAPMINDTQSPFSQFSQAGHGVASRANLRCARCLQPGHTARSCTAPPEQVRAQCKVCGQVGHMAAECPSKSQGHRRIRLAPSETSSFGNPAEPNVSSYAPNPFARAAQSKEGRGPAKQEIQWRSFDDPRRAEETREEGSESIERQARRSRRGFEATVEEAQPYSEPRERRKSRRSMERENDEVADEANALREERAARKSARKAAKRKAAESSEHQPTPLSLPEFISVSQLAQVLNVRYERLLERLEQEGYDDIFPAKILNMETSGMIAMEYNFDPQFEYDTAVAREEQERDLKPRTEAQDKSLLPTRPPVVTIMGHVDHGKTTILDFLRKSSVAAGEAGGITQHIGAFSVPLSSSERTITFLDTPGHAAFLAMRQRGANVTDIVVLVVAADDSVKPQTLESLRCAREAGVPILVAINKVDKEGADVQRVKQDLAKHGIEIEDFGGDVQTVEVSGKTGQGMDEFEEAIVTLSEILDHRAETDGDVEGWVLEATTKSHGRVATVLVKRGTLRVGQIIVAGKTWARVRSLKNERGQTLQEVGPGMPVEVDGWKEQAAAGDQVLQAPNEQKAGSVVDYRTEVADREKANEDMEAINEARRLEQEKRAKEKAVEKAEKLGETAPIEDSAATVQDQEEQTAASGQMTVPFIIKADVSGSAEAVAAYIPSLSSPLIAPQILTSGVGAVNPSDIEFAATANGHIIAFNLPQNNDALGMAESQGVKILENDVIYRTLDQVKELLEDKLPPIVTQRVLGEAEIAAGFEIGLGGRKKMKIAGCKIRNGIVGMKTKARVMRGGVGGEKVYDGEIEPVLQSEFYANC